jgi:hypothetical protein
MRLVHAAFQIKEAPRAQLSALGKGLLRHARGLSIASQEIAE